MARQATRPRPALLPHGDTAHVHSPPGHQGLNPRRAGCRESRLEAGAGGEGNVAREPARTSTPSAIRSARASCAPRSRGRGRPAGRRLEGPSRDGRPSCLRMDEPRERVAAIMCGLDVRYDLGEGHPLLAARARFGWSSRPTVAAGVHVPAPLPAGAARAQRRGGFDVATSGRSGVQSIDAKHGGLGAAGNRRGTAPSAVLIRPDGHVAWAGDRARLGLVDALAAWFGPPTAVPSAPGSSYRRATGEDRPTPHQAARFDRQRRRGCRGPRSRDRTAGRRRLARASSRAQPRARRPRPDSDTKLRSRDDGSGRAVESSAARSRERAPLDASGPKRSIACRDRRTSRAG